MEKIQLKPFYWNGKDWIGVSVQYHQSVLIKKVSGIKWNSGLRCWYLPCDRKSYELLKQVVDGNFELDIALLKSYLQQRKVMLVEHPQKINRLTMQMMIQHSLNQANLDALTAYKNLLTLKGYSLNTIKNYTNELHQLLRLLGDHSINELKKEHIMSYLLWLLEKKGCSETKVHMAVNAIKFYFEQVMGRGKEFYDLPRPKKPWKLPAILAEEEVVTMIKSIVNIKHRTMIMTGYSAGLRVSEIINLKISNIDSKRMMIHVQNGKGKKDRMVPLSKRLLEILRIYFKAYQPKEYLFEGQAGGQYSARSLQEVLQAAKLRSRINKVGSIHMLRHSYATHLMDAGTDIRFIQDLLGHNSIRTTMRYTHVTNKQIAKIGSPLDKLDW